MPFPKISIVTPSYNQAEFIEETINSVLEQQYPNLEYIIIDGGSTDKTIEIIKRYEKHLKHWVSEPDKGQSDAINKGLRLCTGDVFNWLNSDDYLEPLSLKRIGEAFLNPELLLFAGQCRKFGEGCNETIIPEHHNCSTYDSRLLNSNYLQPSVFIRKQAIDEIGGVSSQLHYCMDYELYMKYFLAFGTENILEENIILAHARLHSNSKTVTQLAKFNRDLHSIWYNLLKQLNGPEDLLNKLKKAGILNDYAPHWSINHTPDINRIIQIVSEHINPVVEDSSYIYRNAAGYYTFLGDKRSAYKSSIQAIKEAPYILLNYKYLLASVINILKQ